MSTTTAPAPKNETPPPAPTAPDDKAKTEAEQQKRDLIARVLGNGPKKPAPPAAEKKTDGPAAAAATPPAAPTGAPKENPDAAPAAAAEPQPKVKKLKPGPPLPEKQPSKPVDQIVREVVAEVTAKPAPAAATPTLRPEDERDIELARFAEKKDPQKYAGFGEKVSGFFAARDEHVAAKAKELGGQNSAEFREYLSSPEWTDWLKQHQPSFQRGDKTKFQEDMIADRAREQAAKEFEPKFKELDRKTRELVVAPQIRANTEALLKNGILAIGEGVDDPALKGFVTDARKFGEAHPEEAQVIATTAAEYVEQIDEVYRVTHDLVDLNPTARPAQAKIREFMGRQNGTLQQKHPNGLEMADGKILIDAQTYAERGLASDPRYRVFSADEIAGMLAATGNAEILARLNRRREGVQKSIYATPKPGATPPAGAGGQATPQAEEVISPEAVGSRPGGLPSKPVVDARAERNRKYGV